MLGHRDIEIGGLLVSSFAGFVLATCLVMLALRPALRLARLDRWTANGPLAEAGLALCLLALLIVLL
ncbi:DUF1656 domain-containing protein [Methylobacterium oryzihabitans]|uniref:DUF1656 domain-containing protein n=1 Tax=Methylobacterium oryzihabitans TaxID=2499852 RepID=A0A3S2V995_9HYPH|nr:DUF1656 domain-containing protein [Methylobacterium oryzihabitans]RVU17087.1 DUF1656 domain-containing protein [Methylobacterium oryzihabitans]